MISIRKLPNIILFLFVGLLGLQGCGPKPTPLVRDEAPPRQEDTKQETPDRDQIRQEIRIGMLVPLSGPNSVVGEALFNAATMALFDSRDKRLRLIPADTRGTQPGARGAFVSLLEQKVDIILGPLFADNIRAIKDDARKAGVKIIGFSTDHTVAGNGVYLLSFRPEEQVRRILHFATLSGHERFAALIPETSYGRRVLEVFGQTVAQLGKEMTAVEFYKPIASELFEPVKKIANYQQRRREYLDEVEFLESLGEDDFARDLLDEIKHLETLGDVDYDAILIPEGGALLRTLAPLLPYYEVDPEKVKFLGTGLWDDETLRHEPPLRGGWYAAPAREQANRFLERYEETFGKTAPRLATLGYDALALVATLVRPRPIPDFSDHLLTDPAGFMGIDGLFRFSEDGLCHRGLAVYEISAEGFTMVSPAPQTFMRPQEDDLMPESASEEHSEADGPDASFEEFRPASPEGPDPQDFPAGSDPENRRSSVLYAFPRLSGIRLP